MSDKSAVSRSGTAAEVTASPPASTPAAGSVTSASRAAAGPPTLDASLDRLRVSIAKVIQRYFQPLFFLTVGTALFLFLIIATALYAGRGTAETMALAASVQVAFGMIIGYVCVYIGLMMTWFGIDASYTIRGSLDVGGAKGEGALKSASPGLLFALGGMVLIAVSLYKPIVYSEKGGLPDFVQTTQQGPDPSSDGETIKPNPAPPLPARTP